MRWFAAAGSCRHRTTLWAGKKVTGTICAKHPAGRSGKWCLSPFSVGAIPGLRGPLLGAGVWLLALALAGCRGDQPAEQPGAADPGNQSAQQPGAAAPQPGTQEQPSAAQSPAGQQSPSQSPAGQQSPTGQPRPGQPPGQSTAHTATQAGQGLSSLPGGAQQTPGAATQSPPAEGTAQGAGPGGQSPSGAQPQGAQSPAGAQPQGDQPSEQPRILADLLKQPGDAVSRMIPGLELQPVDPQAAAAQGIRKLAGRRLTLYTDLPASPEIERLPAIFDQAFPQYCSYFGVDPAKLADWHVRGFLMREKVRFVEAKLLPPELPPFPNGYARNYELWLYHQPSDYYTRHLLLHEGVHCFMNTVLGGCGPPWYMEGTAELLGTHRLDDDGRLTLGVIPPKREEVEYWGRIRIVKDAVAARRAKHLQEVLDFQFSAFIDTSAYGWAWAAAALIDGHPECRRVFRGMAPHVVEADFTERFRGQLGERWPELCEQWQVFITGIEYGYDVERSVIDFTPGRPLPAEGATVSVASDRGWQNSGYRLEAGRRYILRASGRYQLAQEPVVWWCEPGGVSIRYYQGMPLGQLLAAVRPDRARPEQPSALLRPYVVGLGATLLPPHSGTLYLKINDSAAELSDNQGEAVVQITAGP